MQIATGRSFPFPSDTAHPTIDEFTIMVSGLQITLGPGTYWLTVAPRLFGPVSTSYVPVTGGLNAVGSPPGNDGDSFFHAPNVPRTFESASTILGFQADFSMGVAGVKLPLLAGLGPAKVWVGLRNSDDIGIRLDLRADIYRNTTLIGAGQLASVPGGSSGFNNARFNTIPLTLTSGPVVLSPGDSLAMSVSVRNACVGSKKNSGTARIWYNGQPLDSGANRDAGTRFDAIIGETAVDYFLREGLSLSTIAGFSRASRDAVAGPKCGAFKPFATWSVTIP